jgi:hypothetical protein
VPIEEEEEEEEGEEEEEEEEEEESSPNIFDSAGFQLYRYCFVNIY